MRKDKNGIRDYAVRCFERWTRFGYPTAKEYEEQIREKVREELAGADPQDILIACENAVNKQRSIIEDIIAIERLFTALEEQGRGEYAEAVQAVYCHEATYRNDISYRTISFARKHYMDERTIYKYLKAAMVLWGKYRGLTTEDEF